MHNRLTPRHPRASTARGFTLIEVLVALTVLATMAAMSWQSIDALLRTQARNEQAALSTHLLHSTLQQWEADLNAIAESGVVSAVDFDGKRLRLTRRDPLQPGEGLRVVTWSLETREGKTVLLRWQSPLVTSRAQIDSAWLAAAQSGTERAGEISTVPADQWSLFYFRRNAWVNPLSANEQAEAEAIAAQAQALADAVRRSVGGLGVAPTSATPTVAVNAQLGLVPDGIRLQLQSQGAPAFGSTVIKDWIRPQWTPSQN